MTRAKTIIILGASFGLALSMLGCNSTPHQPESGIHDGAADDSGVPDGGADSGVPDGGVDDSGVPDGGADDSGVPDGGPADSGVPDGGADAGCPECPPPTCSIACVPHHISRGQSTTFYWSSNGSACSLSCPGLGLQLDVPCNGQDSSHFQNLQETQMCTFTATGPGGTVSCSDSVVVN